MQEDRNNSIFCADTEEQPCSSDPFEKVCIREDLLLVNAGEYVSYNTEQKPHTCDQCSKTFTTKKNLIAHLRKHIENPISCDQCGKVFRKNFQLVLHLRSHTGEKPFACEHCGKAFASKSARSMHNRVHSGEKPYSCDICGDTFTWKKTLDHHLLNHEKNKSIFSQ